MGSSPAPPRDFSQPVVFSVDEKRPNKTVDIGRDGTSVSAETFGTILQLSAYHPEHGVVLAAPYAQFDKTRYYEPTYVRHYRTKMLQMITKGETGFGFRVLRPGSRVSIGIPSMDTATMSFKTDAGADVHCRLQVHGNGVFAQQILAKNETASPVDFEYTLDLRLSVHRASYGQLTEGGPVPLPDCKNNLSIQDDSTFVVSNPNLGVHLVGCLYTDGKLASQSELNGETSTGVLSGAMTPPHKVALNPGSTRSFVAYFKLSPRLDVKGIEFPPPLPDLVIPSPDKYWKNARLCKTFVIRRNIDYILANCTIPIGDGVVGMITDHVALPLGWNRDNYWQWRLLLTARQNLDALYTPEGREKYLPAIESTLKGHLRWVYERAQRPHGFWHRSYIISGKPKDGPTFQLDQQCYPFLEICDYLKDFPDDKDFVKRLLDNGTVCEVLRILVSKQDPLSHLFPTDETPGDDAVDHPYHFSSHVLLWHTLVRLADIFRIVGVPSGVSIEETQALADQIRNAALHHFLTEDDATGEPIIAYLVDGKGQKTLYHDANDIPTVFAESLGFFQSDEQVQAWRNTMAFAVSPSRNRLGYAIGGPFAGLGSVHSKGPWPLGYSQELFYAHRTGDAAAQADAARRIVGAMQWDGTFGEAVDAVTGTTTSKAWFSWPGSMISSTLIQDGIEI